MPFFENASNFVMKNCTFTKINADGSEETWTCHEANTDDNASPFIPEAESTSTSNRQPSASDTCDDPFVNPDGPPALVEELFIDNSNPNGVRRRHATRRSRRTGHGNHHCMTTTTAIVSTDSNNSQTVLVRDSFNSYDGEDPPHMPFRRRSVPRVPDS
ncbi:hypothetical protein PLEOSDRAFT_1108637 [Pleurotus ostreatus PC15]|uniref:Uncharacterized protein n=1 Tax=Pleurotus ostreatus (strain PC15) TaxID=1137138 RepID=A0A067N7Q5_PLEO1|nr:hypothetical protein PLEOSDRAFT_1108637 [Pleurotus ostreatus PC15]